MLFDIFTIYRPSKTLIPRSSVFARCFPASLLPLFMDDFPFCEFRPLYAIGSNRHNKISTRTVMSTEIREVVTVPGEGPH